MRMIKKYLKNIYISPDERQKIIDNVDINMMVQSWNIKK